MEPSADETGLTLLARSAFASEAPTSCHPTAGSPMTTFENSREDYVRFAIDTVDTFVAGNGRPPSMDFVMTHLRHTSLLFG